MKIVVGIIVVLLAVAIIGAVTREPPAGVTQSECDNGIMAYVMSKHFVEARLRSPATAEWAPSSDVHVEPLGHCQHRVTAYVDSQNAFGALIRTRYVVSLVWEGEHNWRLLAIDFSPQ